MIFSRALLGTNTNKIRLSWWDYWILHCWMTGWQSIRNNFITWMDLVWFEDNQKHYTLLKDDVPFEQCYTEFWFVLNDDDVYPKEFLESLMQMFYEKKWNNLSCDEFCDIVKEWMSQYTHYVMTGEWEYLKGYDECLTVLEENLK
jgi:hypothetical protein